MSEETPRSILAVLPPDVPESLLDDLTRECAARGWPCETSRGTEQTIVALAPGADPEELERLFGDRVEADVLPVRTREEYANRRLRRSLMHWVMGLLGLVLAFTLGILVLFFLVPPKVPPQTPDTLRAASVDEIEPGGAKLLRFWDRTILLVHLRGDHYFALRATCPLTDHCQLDWSVPRQALVCPCHGGTFDVHGSVLEGPSAPPLRSYRVEKVGDEIYVTREE